MLLCDVTRNEQRFAEDSCTIPTDTLLPNTLPLLVAMSLLLNTHTGGDTDARYPFLVETLMLNTYSGGGIFAQYQFWWRQPWTIPSMVETLLLVTLVGICGSVPLLVATC